MNPDSCECSKAELELFSVPPTNISMEKGSVMENIPISSVGDNSPIEFHINSTDEYIDLGRTFLYVKAKIVKKDKNDIAENAKVGPVNLWFHSLFSQIDIKLNGKLITPSVNTYPYKAYLETLLSYGSDAKESQLTSELWFLDNNSFDQIDPHLEEDSNEGFARRGQFCSQSKSVEMMGRLHCDIFQQDRYLLNGVEMNIKLIRSPETFHLMADGSAFTTLIEEACLYVRKVKLNPAIPVQHNKMLSQGKNAKYPVRRGVVSTFTIPKDQMSINKDNVTMGQLPRRIVVGLVTNKAFNGAVNKNPFDFKHFDLNYFALYLDGEQYPTKPLTPNFSGNEFLRSYMTLFEGTGMLNDDKGHGIERSHYKDGFALYAFDLTPDMTEGSHVDPIKHGNVRMDIHFKETLKETVNVIVYAEYDNVIQIDRARNVIVDY